MAKRCAPPRQWTTEPSRTTTRNIHHRPPETGGQARQLLPCAVRFDGRYLRSRGRRSPSRRSASSRRALSEADGAMLRLVANGPATSTSIGDGFAPPLVERRVVAASCFEAKAARTDARTELSPSTVIRGSSLPSSMELFAAFTRVRRSIAVCTGGLDVPSSNLGAPMRKRFFCRAFSLR